MKKYFVILGLLFWGFILSSCSEHSINAQNKDKPKYIFLFIGDGMGENHVNLCNSFYLGLTNSNNPLIMQRFPNTGTCSTQSADNSITDSGAAASALACGEKVPNGVISYYPNYADSLKPRSIAKIAHQNNFKVGIITTVGINHATPAAFYAENESRYNYYEIGLDLYKSDFEFFGSGGYINPTNDNTSIDLYELTEQNNYTIISNLEELYSLNSNTNKVFFKNPVTLSESDLPYEIDRDQLGGYSLDEIVNAAIKFLDNDNGFFIMIEGGKIDWAAHRNDAASIVYEVMAFNNAILKAYEFYSQHPDETLVIVTADHETGGMSYSNNDFMNLSLQACSHDFIANEIQNYKNSTTTYSFDEVISIIKNTFFTSEIIFTDNELHELNDAFNYYFYGTSSLSSDELYSLYGNYNPIAIACTKIINDRSSVNFTSWGHTGTNVPVYSIGSYSELFDGTMDNTDISKNIRKIMKRQL